MKVNVEIIRITQLETNKIDYDRIIYKVNYPKKVDIENSRHLQILLYTLVQGGAKKLLINVHDLEYIDSSGIGTFISIAKQIRKNDGDIVLSGASSNLMSILKVVNLPEFIRVFNTEGEAINHYHAL